MSMETKRRYRLPDDAEISNENEYEKEKQQSKKRKITQDDTASKLAKKIKSRNASTSSYLPLQIMGSVKQESKRQGERAIDIESEPVGDTDIGEKYVWKKKVERDVIGVRPTNSKISHLPLKVMCSVMEEKRIRTRPAKTKNSHLSLQVKCSVIEEKRREIERIREIEKVKSGEEKMIKKEEHEERMAFWSRVRGQQRPAKFLDIHAKIYGKFYGQEYRNLSNAGSDGKIDQAGTEEAEGTGSSCSPELLHGEEIGDNFEGTGLSCSPELLHGEEIGDNFEMMITL